MKINRLLASVSALAIICTFSACSDKKNKPVQIISPTGSLHVEVGDEISITAQTKQQETIKWYCEDGDIAAITADGKLTGVANGITVITAKTDSGYDHVGLVVGNGVKGTEVVVKTDDSSATSTEKKNYNKNSKITDLSISLNGMKEDETLILKNNDVATFKVTVSPSDCTDPIDFVSSNPSVAEVDKNGTVTPKSRGSAKITATAPNGVEDTFTVFVR